MTRTKWGKAKHQIYVLREDILVAHARGENLETIYQHLKSENKITIAKRTFRRHAALIRDEGKTPPKMNPHVNGASPIAPSAKSSVVSVAGQPTTTVLNKHTPATKTAIKHDPTSSDGDLNKLYGIT
ncbi:MAG: hypothetical protein JKY17_08560 [Magnetovibrio sp.]|nr:hypothetical protein [Magnetovibrio sp.]